MGTCSDHNLWYRLRCPKCEEEKQELATAIALAEMENAKPIEVWIGSRR